MIVNIYHRDRDDFPNFHVWAEVEEVGGRIVGAGEKVGSSLVGTGKGSLKAGADLFDVYPKRHFRFEFEKDESEDIETFDYEVRAPFSERVCTVSATNMFSAAEKGRQELVGRTGKPKYFEGWGFREAVFDNGSHYIVERLTTE